MICKFIFFRNQSSLITMREKELTIRPTDQLLRTKVNFPWKESYLIDIVASLLLLHLHQVNLLLVFYLCL